MTRCDVVAFKDERMASSHSRRKMKLPGTQPMSNLSTSLITFARFFQEVNYKIQLTVGLKFIRSQKDGSLFSQDPCQQINRKFLNFN